MPSGVRRLLVGLFVLAQVSHGGAQTARSGSQLIPVYGWGVGKQSCGTFIRETDERDADQTLTYEGQKYHPQRRLYYEWLSGFLTSRSASAGEAGKGRAVSGGHDMNDMVSWIRHYCEANPLDSFFVAALKLEGEVSR
jgi:hypothetical protein